MYNFFVFTNIIIVLTATVIVFVILIFPIFINGNIIISNKDRKGYFNINLFGIINILGGYVEIIKEGLAFHVSNVKAYVLPFNKLFFIKYNIKPLRDYHLKKCKIIILKSQENYLDILPYCFAYAMANNIINDLLKVTKPYLDYDNVIYIKEGENYFSLFLKLSVVVNIFTFLLNMFKKIIGKMFYGKRKSKQN